MANILNDRDITLQAAPSRLTTVNSDYISFVSSADRFEVNGTEVTPTSITITFLLNGRLSGTPTITTTNLTSVTTTSVNSTITTVVVPYSSLTADTCTVKATLVYAGNTYTTTAKISGKTLAPAAVASGGSITVEGGALKLYWPANAEIDLYGYEVRTENSSWGTDSAYVFKGNANTCTAILTEPTSVNSSKTFYIRAYNTANLYSASSRTLIYNISAPPNPTNVTSEYPETSATNSVVNVSWTNAVPVFGLKEYRVKLTLPDGLTTKTWYVSTPNIAIEASWIGTSIVNVYTVDLLGNESSGTANHSISKNAPSTVVAAPTPVKPIGKNLLLDWYDNTKTTLPVVGYEVRNLDADWGIGDSQYLLWKGSATECQVEPGALGAVSEYYIKAIDSDSVYSTSALQINYTRTRPPAVADVVYSYYTSSTGQASVVFTWERPVGETFAIDFYRIKLEKPGPVVEAIDTYSNSWTVPADWEGSATLTVKAVDVFGEESLEYTETIYKAPLSISKYTIASPTVVNDTLSLSWTPVFTSTSKSWTRVGNVATIQDTAHGYVTGDIVNITSTSNTSTIPLQAYYVTLINANSYSIVCKNTGPTSGTLVLTYGSLAASAYEIRASDNFTVLYRGSSTNYAVPGDKLNTGTNTYYLHAIDSAGKYSSSSRQISYNYVVLSGITGSASFTSSGTALFKWNAPSTGSFAVKEYELSMSGSGLTATRSTTDWEIPVTWTNSTATLTITPRDVLGTLGTSKTVSLTNALLPAPGAVTSTLKGTSLELDWPDISVNTSTQLPVGRYELLDTDGNIVWKGSQSKAIIPLEGVTPQKRTWSLYVYDTNGYRSASARTYEYTDLVNPSAVALNSVSYSFGTNKTDSLLTITWSYSTPRFGLKYYRVSYIDGDQTVTTTTLSSSITISPIPKSAGNTLWTGQKVFSITVVDNLGNESSVTQVSVQKLAPGKVSGYTSQVIDNTVLLQWTLPARTTLPINTLRLKKGASWDTATLIGDKTGTFTTVLERVGAVYTYWLAAVDSDGVEGTPIALTTTVSQPPDYIFLAEKASTFTGTKTNALITADGSLVLPVDLTSTWQTHFTSNSWSTPNDQVNANYPVYIQPTPTPGSYEEILDFGGGAGVVLSSAKITVNFTGAALAGDPIVTTTIDTSADGVTWLPEPIEGQAIFGTNFRYVKVKITVSHSDGGRGLYRITSLDVSLDAKQKTDSNTATLFVGAAEPQGSIAPDYVSLWVPGSLPSSSIFGLNGTAAENSITYSEGMAGRMQAIWNCIDTDTASDTDGGWDTSYFTADMSKGHLFAVFMRTTTNAGTSYWGTSKNSTILTLAGAVNSNPYFWSGDLPAVDTWYLVVGYVHPIGYSGAAANISGVYDLTGTRLVAGTEYKAASGTTSLMHRAYHYSNAQASGLVVQQMSRPVVIPVEAAAASNTIQYLLQCATKYGASVDTISQFVDITSITATPQGSVPTTLLVDFFDKPNPKRFNLFNYNSSGNLVAGTVSWTVRGY